MPLYEIDTIITYRLKYAIEANELSDAFDEIKSNIGFDEISQRFLGEQITGGREITIDEFHSLLGRLKNDPAEFSSAHMGVLGIHKINYEKSEKSSAENGESV